MGESGAQVKSDNDVMGEAMAKCGPNARAILRRQAERLTMGAVQYGDDFDDGRDWLIELINEISDAENYTDRIAALGPLPERLAVVRAMLSDCHRLLQAEFAERDTLPAEAAE